MVALRDVGYENNILDHRRVAALCQWCPRAPRSGKLGQFDPEEGSHGTSHGDDRRHSDPRLSVCHLRCEARVTSAPIAPNEPQSGRWSMTPQRCRRLARLPMPKSIAELPTAGSWSRWGSGGVEVDRIHPRVLSLCPTPLSADTITVERARMLHGKLVVASFLVAKPRLHRGRTILGACGSWRRCRAWCGVGGGG